MNTELGKDELKEMLKDMTDADYVEFFNNTAEVLTLILEQPNIKLTLAKIHNRLSPEAQALLSK